jgi:hypothetical protein
MWAVASDPSPPSKPSRACKKSTKADHALQNDFGSDSFEQQIVIDAEAGSAPNIAVFPQPGLAADMAARGF